MLKILCLLLMINPATLSTRLTGLVGFKQPYNPKYAILDAPNQASRSGLYVTDNPFVKIEAIKDSQDYDCITDDDFNNFLRNKLTTSIVNVANAVFSDNDFIDRQLIYKHALNKYSNVPTYNGAVEPGTENPVNTYNLPPGFQCYWFQVNQGKNIAFKIQRVFMEFNGVGPLTLYLYNTANLSKPLQKQTINVTGPITEVLLDWVCDNSAQGAGYKGDYYLGYFTNEAINSGLQPFKREYREAILMSRIDNFIYYRSAFQNFTDPTKPFDLMGYSPYNYYNGINPDISLYEDFTDLMIQNEKLFARAIQLDCQISMLSESVASIRSNRNERMSMAYAAQIMAQIEGEDGEGNVKVTGLKKQFFGALATIKKELKKLKEGYEADGLITVQTLT